MNMISTGAFQTEMDASNKQPTLAEKFAAVWEKKNTKAARAGGVSLMALSLAACGSDSETTSTATDTTTTTTTTTEPVASAFNLTPLDDIASETQALNGSLTSTFRFTSGDDVVNGMTATMSANDVLIDGSATDSDTLNITGTGSTAVTSVNIENVVMTAASGTVILDASAMAGLTSVSVSGSVAATVDNVAQAATIKSDSYGRILKTDATAYSGTAAGLNPDSVSLEIAGGAWGSTAATQSGFNIDSDGASAAAANIETLNITSSGSAANVYGVAMEANVAATTINLLGSADQTVRVEAGDVTAKTIDGTQATGTVTLRIDTHGTSAALNAANYSGIDNLMMADSTVGSDNGSVSSLAAGDKVTMVDDFNGENSVLTVKGATYTSMASSLTVVLDNETASTDVDMQQLDVQNVSTLNLESSGFVSTSTAATAVNLIDDLVGDATSVVITGDTSLNLDGNIDAVQTATSATSARAVTVDASGMTGTAFLDFTAEANAKVSYTVTGTGNADTIVANSSGSTFNGGAGNDTLTGNLGVDTYDGGAGKDHIDISGGADTVTLGTGVDTVDVDLSDTAAVTEKQTITATIANGALEADTHIAMSVNGETISFLNDVSVATNSAKLSIAIDAALKLSTGYANGDFTVSTTTNVTTLVFDADLGDIADIKTWEASVDDGLSAGLRTFVEAKVGTATKTTTIASADVSSFTGAVAVDVNTTFTDFSSDDVIDFALSLGANYFEGDADAVAGAADAANGVIVLTDETYLTASAAEDDVAGSGTNNSNGIVIFLNSTTGTAQGFLDDDIGADGATEEALFVFSNITNLADLASTFSADNFVIA